MKVVRAKLANAAVTVPVRGSFRVQFINHQAIVPDDVADVLVGLGPHFYQIVAPTSTEALTGKNVLVIRDMGLGDVLLTIPLIRALHEQHNAVVDVLTKEQNRCLFDGNPHVRATYALEDPRFVQGSNAFRQYDLVIDLRLVVENAELQGRYEHRADAFAAFAEVTLIPEQRRPDFFLKEEERTQFSKPVHSKNERSARPRIGYVWRSSTKNRNWSIVQHAKVLRALVDAGYQVAIVDHEKQFIPSLYDESGVDCVLNLTGTLSIREVAALFSTCDAVITPDTGLFHLAGALDVPTVTYFGPMPIEERAAHKTLTVLNAKEKCALFPCRGYGCLNFDEEGQSRCLSVAPEAVVAAVRDILQNERLQKQGEKGDSHNAAIQRGDQEEQQPGGPERSTMGALDDGSAAVPHNGRGKKPARGSADSTGRSRRRTGSVDSVSDPAL